MTNERNNPWAGLASYEDPAKSERKLKFCGRDNDIYDVARLIDDNLLLILYGKSGIGKTSLLNAGVFPKLRLEQYLPVSIRLGTLEADASYQEAVVDAIESAIEEVRGSITVFNVVEDQADNQQPERLWNYFARHHFANAEGQPLFPVVVLDQFEEVLRNANAEHVRKAQTLLNQIQYIIDESHALNDCVVDGREYYYDFNFRFVISIREDELYLLEDNIDDLSLSMFRNCRYRLRSLSEQGATEAILVPGKDCISEEQKQAVVDRVIALSKRPQSNDIDTLLLSLVCSGTFDKKAGEKITVSDLAVWKSNPMEVYYQDAVKGLPADHVRYIQQHLIREDGSRRRVDAQEVKTALGEATYRQLTLGANRLLTLGDKGQVELLHDQLGMAVYEERKAFEERERKKKLRRKMVAIGIIVIGFIWLSIRLLNLVKTNLITQDSLEKSVLQNDSLQILNESLANQINLNERQNDSILFLNKSLSDQMRIITAQSDSLSKSLFALQKQIKKNKEQEEIIIQQNNVINGKAQIGYVKTAGKPNHPGAPLPGVVIRVSWPHNPGFTVVSDSEGVFWLPIEKGEIFRIIDVRKNGYQLLDPDILKRDHFASSAVPLQIVLIAENDLYEDYRKVTGNAFKVLQERMLEILNELKKENDSLKLQIQFLREQVETTAPEIQSDSNVISNENYLDLLKNVYESNLSLIGDMADRYAHTDYDNLDSLQYQINLCIENGELAKADSLIHTVFDPETILEPNRTTAIDKSRRELAIRCHNLAQLYLISDDKDKAKECLHQAIEIERLLYGEDSQIVKETQSQIEAINNRKGHE